MLFQNGNKSFLILQTKEGFKINFNQIIEIKMKFNNKIKFLERNIKGKLIYEIIVIIITTLKHFEVEEDHPLHF